MDAGFLDQPVRPKWKYKSEKPPVVFLVIDDAMGTEIMNPKSGLVQLCISHRHLGCPDRNGCALGLSIALLAQSYSAQGGIPRPIRENATHLCLFKNKDENQMLKIHEEIGQDISVEQFDNYFKYATETPHSFLMVDFHPKEKFLSFRKNFDEILFDEVD